MLRLLPSRLTALTRVIPVPYRSGIFVKKFCGKRVQASLINLCN
jgi:hypothetical protein